jgi:pyruvate/2-oxoglutarate dehydrogenase complex dihydrolipoamide dehydrogenase (E3) component
LTGDSRGGTGSTIARWTFAGEGKQVAVVERKYIGGSCPNIACSLFSKRSGAAANRAKGKAAMQRV